MKKIYALVIALLAFLVGAFVIVSSKVDEQKDQVQLKETIVYGDRRIAEGLTLTTRNHLNYHLFWETTCQVEKEILCDTKYNFFAMEKREEAERNYRNFEIFSGIETYSAFYGYNIYENQEESEPKSGIELALKELMDETEEGEKKTKTIYLKDYYKYYPLRISIESEEGTYHQVEINSERANEDVLAKKFSEFLKIPVLESDCVNITVSKSDKLSNGNFSTGQSVEHTGELYYFSSCSAYVSSIDSWFFTVSNQKNVDSKMEYMDMSEIPGGYGVYSFSYNRALNPPYIEVDSLRMVFPLNKEEIVKEILVRDDETRMLLLTWEGDETYIKVIDIETMTELQKFKISDGRRYLYYNSIHEYDDFVVVVLDNLSIALLSDENGRYTHEFTVESNVDEMKMTDDINEQFINISETSGMDFDGEKLVVVGTIGDRYMYECCDFYISVYDKTGLIYFGKYETSLSANLLAGSYSANECRPAEVKPFEVEWKH